MIALKSQEELAKEHGKTVYINNACDRHIIIEFPLHSCQQALGQREGRAGVWDTPEVPYFCFLQNTSVLSPAEPVRSK